MNRCEWNPRTNEPATSDDGCHEEARWSIGSNGQWHLCDNCQKLPQFKRFSVRKKLKTLAGVVQRVDTPEASSGQSTTISR